jgi:hypothetical protein
MAEAVAARVRRYILDGSDQDLRRLVSISQGSELLRQGAHLPAAKQIVRCRAGASEAIIWIDSCGENLTWSARGSALYLLLRV